MNERFESVKSMQIIEVIIKRECPFEIGDVKIHEITIKQYYDLYGNFLAETNVTQTELEKIAGIWRN